MTGRKCMLPDLGVLFIIEDTGVPDVCSSHDCMTTTTWQLQYVCHDDFERSEVIVSICERHADEVLLWYEKVRQISPNSAAEVVLED